MLIDLGNILESILILQIPSIIIVILSNTLAVDLPFTIAISTIPSVQLTKSVRKNYGFYLVYFSPHLSIA
jgi:hypothetical protein